MGFGITILSAAYSHLSSGDGLMALDPLVIFSALVLSYRTRPADRRLNIQPTAWSNSPEGASVVVMKEAR